MHKKNYTFKKKNLLGMWITWIACNHVEYMQLRSKVSSESHARRITVFCKRDHLLRKSLSPFSILHYIFDNIFYIPNNNKLLSSFHNSIIL